MCFGAELTYFKIGSMHDLTIRAIEHTPELTKFRRFLSGMHWRPSKTSSLFFSGADWTNRSPPSTWSQILEREYKADRVWV